jgi:benzoylformate decarboxylase
MTGADWLLRALAAEGVTRLFGNPGSTELPIIEAVARQERVEYVLCLHEAAALGMADGYAQATGRLAAVNVHVQPGMANSLAGILNAARSRVPLLVTVGQQASTLVPHAPFLGGDVLGMAAPLAKGGWEPTSADELARDLGAAVQCALTPPMGPVVLSIPMDVQAGPAPAAPHRPQAPPRAPAPDDATLERAARLLADATSPVLIAGDEVATGGCGAQVERLAERLGAPVHGEPFGARMPVDAEHPHWRGPLPGFAAQIRPLLAGHDVVLAIGMPVFRLFGESPGPALVQEQRLVHLDVDPDEIGRTHPPEVGIVGDPGHALSEILRRLPRSERRAAPAPPTRAGVPEGGDRIDPATFCRMVAAAVRPEDIVVDEALTAGRRLRSELSGRGPDNWFAHRGSALGWGLPAAVGIALARPERRVMVVHGDGSALFGMTALWSAANRGRGIAVVIADNRGYEILRAGMEGMTGRAEGPWPGLRLDDPPLDLEALAKGFGARALSAATPAQLEKGLQRLWDLAEDGPAVLVVRGRTAPVGYPPGGDARNDP